MAGSVDPDMLTAPFQLTASMRRDVYPAVDPKNPELNVKGKVVLITGAAGLLGHVSYYHLAEPGKDTLEWLRSLRWCTVDRIGMVNRRGERRRARGSR